MPAEKKSAPKKKVAKKKNNNQAVKYMPNLRKHYLENVTSKLIERFNYANPMEVPKIATIHNWDQE